MERRMELQGKFTIGKVAMEKIMKDQVVEIMREVKEGNKRREEEMKDLRREVESLKRKVDKLEQSAGKRKRDDSEESRGRRKWWTEEYEKNDDEKRKKNIIIRIEKERWMGERSNWEKMKELFSEGLKVNVEVKE